MKKYTEQRPWGKFEQFCKNETVSVKILQVNPNEELSLQYHHNRDEFWRVLEGSADILIGTKRKTANKGDEFFIPRETNHQIIAKTSVIIILEISFGNFDESDIVRLSDKYHRV